MLLDHLTSLIVNKPPDSETVDRETFEPDPEVYFVSQALASQLAALPDDQIDDLVDCWFGNMREKSGDPYVTAPTPDFRKAVWGARPCVPDGCGAGAGCGVRLVVISRTGVSEYTFRR